MDPFATVGAGEIKFRQKKKRKGILSVLELGRFPPPNKNKTTSTKIENQKQRCRPRSLLPSLGDHRDLATNRKFMVAVVDRTSDRWVHFLCRPRGACDACCTASALLKITEGIHSKPF